MRKDDGPDTSLHAAPPSVLPADGPSLLARYGDLLEGEAMSEAAKQEFLLALWRIMQAFVDLGFSMKPGDKFGPESGVGMDDVLQYLIPEDTAHETVAPPSTDSESEAQ